MKGDVLGGIDNRLNTTEGRPTAAGQAGAHREDEMERKRNTGPKWLVGRNNQYNPCDGRFRRPAERVWGRQSTKKC